MFVTKRNIVISAMAAAAAVILVARIGATGPAAENFKLEGAWIAKVPGTPVQWSYTVSPDPSGRRASLFGYIEVGIKTAVYGYFADSEYQSPLVGEAVIGNDGTIAFSSIWYGIKNGSPFNEIVYIGMNSGHMRPLGPGKMEGTHNLAFYHPDSDQDGDGIPDPGAVPVLSIPAASVDTRLPL
jgi:hypothetical protein